MRNQVSDSNLGLQAQNGKWTLMMLKQHYLLHPNQRPSHQKTLCQRTGLNGNIFTECSSYVIEMCLRPQEDLKCTEEHYNVFFLSDHLDNYLKY